MREPEFFVKCRFVSFQYGDRVQTFPLDSESLLFKVFGWRSTGVKDVNKREIFEGDRVKFGEYDRTGVVEFRNAMFVIAHDNSERFTVLGNTPNFVTVEVIGHIAEETS